MSNEETGKSLIRVDKVEAKGKTISISFSNGETLSCGPDSYSEFRLYEGKEINSIEFKRIKDYARMEKLYSYALGLIASRMRSKKEIRDKLKTQGADLETIRKIIFRLEKQGLLDDKEFAKTYCEEASQYKGLGKLAILAKLKELGISEEILKYLSFPEETELANAIRCVEGCNRRYANSPDKKKKQQCRIYLHRQGFEDHIVEEALENAYESPEEESESALLDKALDHAIAHYGKKYKGYELRKRVLGSLAMKGYDYEDIRSKMEERLDVYQ